jgi:hypothetical protein
MEHRQEKLIYRRLLESRLCVLWNYLWILNEEEPFLFCFVPQNWCGWALSRMTMPQVVRSWVVSHVTLRPVAEHPLSCSKVSLWGRLPSFFCCSLYCLIGKHPPFVSFHAWDPVRLHLCSLQVSTTTFVFSRPSPEGAHREGTVSLGNFLLLPFPLET